jgi:hypothetical protein
VPVEIAYSVLVSLAAVRAVHGGRTQPTKIVKERPALLIFAAKLPETFLRFCRRLHGRFSLIADTIIIVTKQKLKGHEILQREA